MDLCNKKEKFWKYKKKVLFELKCRLQNCLRNSQIACKSEHVLQYRWENLKLNLIMDAAFKILLPSAILFLGKAYPTIQLSV
jgi:hypothetical protein